MSYAHCLIRADVEESTADSIIDDLLQTVAAWPEATHGVYVVVLAQDRAQAVLGARIAANAVPLGLLR